MNAPRRRPARYHSSRGNMRQPPGSAPLARRYRSLPCSGWVGQDGERTMPRVYQAKTTDPKILIAYTVDQAVGAGCPNQRADVLLVQHLLALAWIEIPASKGFRPPGEDGPLKVDGIFGPVTGRFIKFFQEEARRR